MSSTGVVLTGKAALCQDERTIIYDGSGAGNFCPMPFLYNREYYDTCTRKSSSQPVGFENFFWCPDPKSVNLTQQNLFIANGSIGKCNNFLIPPGKVAGSETPNPKCQIVKNNSAKYHNNIFLGDFAWSQVWCPWKLGRNKTMFVSTIVYYILMIPFNTHF